MVLTEEEIVPTEVKLDPTQAVETVITLIFPDVATAIPDAEMSLYAATTATLPAVESNLAEVLSPLTPAVATRPQEVIMTEETRAEATAQAETTDRLHALKVTPAPSATTIPVSTRTMAHAEQTVPIPLQAEAPAQ